MSNSDRSVKKTGPGFFPWYRHMDSPLSSDLSIISEVSYELWDLHISQINIHAVADPEFPKGSASSKRGANLLFGQLFLKTTLENWATSKIWLCRSATNLDGIEILLRPVADLQTNFGHAPHSGPNFHHFHAIFRKVWPKDRLAPPFGVDVLLGNPGSINDHKTPQDESKMFT